jgi:hypothetical protein
MQNFSLFAHLQKILVQFYRPLKNINYGTQLSIEQPDHSLKGRQIDHTVGSKSGSKYVDHRGR